MSCRGAEDHYRRTILPRCLCLYPIPQGSVLENGTTLTLWHVLSNA